MHQRRTGDARDKGKYLNAANTYARGEGIMFDLIIENGTVIDGTGAARRRADVGIVGDLIAALGDLSQAEARRRIDAAGCIVAPGFIDIHCHSDTTLLLNPRAESMIRQGCTTQVIGNCGHTVAPISARLRTQLRETLAVIDCGMEWEWTTFGEFLDAYQQGGIAVNVVPLVGHCAVRADVMGFEDRPPTPEELQRMQRLLAQCMDEGAWGLSAGQMYPPSMYADTEELVELCKTVAARDGIYATHMRSYSTALVESVAETCEIARRSGVRAQVSHLLAAGKPHWGKVEACLQLMEETNRVVEVHADKYPYTAGSANLSQRLPGWAHAGGAEAMLARLADPDTRARIKAEMDNPPAAWRDFVPIDFNDLFVSFVASEKNKPVEGKSIAEIAAARGCDPNDAILDLILEERNRVNMVAHAQSEAETRAVLTHRLGMIGSDGWAVAPYGALGVGKPHPRSYGTFPRVLGRYVRDEKVMSLEEAIYKMTGLPAAKLGLKDRGVLAVGKAADVCVFNPDAVIDRADFANPHQYPDGIELVIVNGWVEIERGRHHGGLRGRVLRKT
ncbi:MAG: D-aminoacylase [Abditibacteriales bacterium]|nr:D-aminoacylase [Abditibacteriales bacterium]